MPDNAISVKQLNLYVKSLLEGDVRLSNIAVCGEISNLKMHYASGHWYFTLKDSDASIRCVMFKFSAARAAFIPQDGMSVILRGRASVYEKDGQYQFYAEEMHSAGEGDLALKFRLLKEKLEAEGLFDSESKRPLKKFPRKIAVITSDSGAAVKDIINIMNRRYPLCSVVLCPVAVQGEAAVPSMLDALERVYELPDIDAVIIGRGGGSAEDLQAFNDEMLARKIYESPFPVISAVGHETDFTICDFVADVRASTPSAAAELAVPNIEDLRFAVFSIEQSAKKALRSKYEVCSARLSAAKAVVSHKNAEALLGLKLLELDSYYDAIISAANSRISSSTNNLERLAARLDALSPLKTLSRGFAVVQADNNPITSAKKLNCGDNIDIVFSDGDAKCIVSEINVRNDK